MFGVYGPPLRQESQRGRGADLERHAALQRAVQPHRRRRRAVDLRAGRAVRMSRTRVRRAASPVISMPRARVKRHATHTSGTMIAAGHQRRRERDGADGNAACVRCESDATYGDPTSTSSGDKANGTRAARQRRRQQLVGFRLQLAGRATSGTATRTATARTADWIGAVRRAHAHRERAADRPRRGQ